MIRSLCIRSFFLLVLTGPARAQTGADTNSPPARAHHVVFYDEARQRVIVSGGAANDARRRVLMRNDIWSFDGTTWTRLASDSDTLLGARTAIGPQNRIYAFGGFGERGAGALRTLGNRGWEQLGLHPSLTVGESGIVFDNARNRFVVFGGSSGRQVTSEVWEYDGSRWFRNAAVGPQARSMHAMVYDSRRRKTVVFGGMAARTGEAAAPILSDTWEFDGTTWTQIRVAGPSPRLGSGAAYDSKRGLLILFGGSDSPQRVLNDLWSWDGTAWRKLAEGGPEPRIMGYLAYDKRRDRIVLFGGRRGVSDNADLGDTWEWDGNVWRRVGN